MRLSAFRTVRARLLALMVLVFVPIVAITGVTATSTYRSVLASIREGQLQTAGNFAVRVRIWYRETLRSLLTTLAAVSAHPPSPGLWPEGCREVARRIVGQEIGIGVLAIRLEGRALCSAGIDAEFDSARVEALLRQFRERPPPRRWIGTPLADTRYGHVTSGTRRYLAVYAARDLEGGAGRVEAIVLVDAAILDRGFELGALSPGVTVGLIHRPGEVIIARGAGEGDRSWLPREEVVTAEVERWTGPAADGRTAVYASQLVAEPDLYVLARFDETAERAAFLQFIALLLTPTLTLALLFAVYSLAIDRNIIRWIKGIEAAAQARASRRPVLAPVDPAMPEDIRRVSEAFNALVAEQAERVEKLNMTVGANRYLVRELHHRVKNSLQVVQSYLSLARRQHGEAHRLVLAEVECKVHVLSMAYRLALAEGEMRPVELGGFLEEVAVMLNGLLRGSTPWITVLAVPDAALVVDRAIPLGLFVVEVAGHSLRTGHDDAMTVTLACNGGDSVVLEIATGDAQSKAAGSRIALGLLRQLEATAMEGALPGSMGRWRIGL